MRLFHSSRFHKRGIAPRRHESINSTCLDVQTWAARASKKVIVPRQHLGGKHIYLYQLAVSASGMMHDNFMKSSLSAVLLHVPEARPCRVDYQEKCRTLEGAIAQAQKARLPLPHHHIAGASRCIQRGHLCCHRMYGLMWLHSCQSETLQGYQVSSEDCDDIA